MSPLLPIMNLPNLQMKEALHKKAGQPYSDSSYSQGEEVAHCFLIVTWQHITRTGVTGQDQQGPQDDLFHGATRLAVVRQQLPAYLVGARRAIAAHYCVELRHWMAPEEPDVELKSI